MTTFCPDSRNLLVMHSTADSMFFKCRSCDKEIKCEPSDTMVYEVTKKTNFIVYRNILRNAKYDPINPEVYADCPNCSYKIAKQVRIGEGMQLINTCGACDNQWLYVE